MSSGWSTPRYQHMGLPGPEGSGESPSEGSRSSGMALAKGWSRRGIIEVVESTAKSSMHRKRRVSKRSRTLEEDGKLRSWAQAVNTACTKVLGFSHCSPSGVSTPPSALRGESLGPEIDLSPDGSPTTLLGSAEKWRQNTRNPWSISRAKCTREHASSCCLGKRRMNIGSRKREDGDDGLSTR